MRAMIVLALLFAAAPAQACLFNCPENDDSLYGSSHSSGSGDDSTLKWGRQQQPSAYDGQDYSPYVDSPLETPNMQGGHRLKDSIFDEPDYIGKRRLKDSIYD